MLFEDFEPPIKIDSLVTHFVLIQSWWKKENSLDLTRVAMISRTSLLRLEEKHRKSITSCTYLVIVHNIKPRVNNQAAQSSNVYFINSYFKQITLLWPQLVTTLNSTLTAPALAKALQLTAKNKTMLSEIKQRHKAFLSNDSLFYDTSFIIYMYFIY